MSSSLKFRLHRDRLLLQYRPDNEEYAQAIPERLRVEGHVSVRKVFRFLPEDYLSVAQADKNPHTPPDVSGSDLTFAPESDYPAPDPAGNEGTCTFVLGTHIDGYVVIPKRILGLKHDLLLSDDLQFRTAVFLAVRDISVFGRIDALVQQQIVIGGSHPAAIPVDVFEALLKHFPTSTELLLYGQARIAGVLHEFFETMTDAESKLQQYVSRTRKVRLRPSSEPAPRNRIRSLVQEIELKKFEAARDKLKEMLGAVGKGQGSAPLDFAYTEKNWQDQIVDIFQILFPQYVAVLEQVHLPDTTTDPDGKKKRFCDLLLISSSGAADVVEIKRPEPDQLLSRIPYRDNFPPAKALSLTVMQAQKYLFHLTRHSEQLERRIEQQYATKLPPGLQVRISNPTAYLILGLESWHHHDGDPLNDQRRLDFEVIRRRHAGIVDIITYDDLLRRLGHTIASFQTASPTASAPPGAFP